MRILAIIAVGFALIGLAFVCVIPHEAITGAIVVTRDTSGGQIKHVVAGFADESGLSVVTTSCATLDLTKDDVVKIIYPSGKERIISRD